MTFLVIVDSLEWCCCDFPLFISSLVEVRCGQGVAHGKGQCKQELVICNFIGALTTSNGKIILGRVQSIARLTRSSVRLPCYHGKAL